MSLRTPLARAKGLGAAGEGVHHWWHQRLTALALVPLTLWLCFAIASLPGSDYASVREWAVRPWNSVLLVITVISAYYHGYLGLQVVLEDYVHNHRWRTAAVIASGFGAVLLATAGVFAVLRLALGVAS